MRYNVIILAHNEALFLEGLLESLCNQTKMASEIILVNDNSSDETEQIMQRYTALHNNIRYINHTSSSEHLPGAKVIQAFTLGFKELQQPFDFLVKLDADLILPKNYFETLSDVFKDPTVGIAGGFCYEQDNAGNWTKNHPMEQDHVRGAFKAYSKLCFTKIGGLIPAMGWDSADELLARYYGFSIKTIETLHVKHLRPLGERYSTKLAKLQGAAFYGLRYGLFLTLLASFKNMFFRKRAIVFLNLLQGYFGEKQKKTPFLVSKNQGRFIRAYRWNKIFEKIKNIDFPFFIK